MMAASRSSCIYRSIHRLFRANQLQALHRCPYESYQFRSKLSCHSKSQNSDDLNDTDPRLLPAEPRRFNNLYLDISQIDESLEEKLDYSIPRWHEQGVRALWAYTPSAYSHHIPMLIKVSCVQCVVLPDCLCHEHWQFLFCFFNLILRRGDSIFIMRDRDLY